jgi:antitoxin component YwqK of YwqJK toxin-antitoxin module
MLKHTRVVVLVVAVSSGPAWAQAKVAIAPRPTVALVCPAGTAPAGGPESAFEASVCVKFSPTGQRLFHGPYVAYWPNGTRQSEGQYLEGARHGRWVFYDQAGNPSGETSFKAGSYDGVRIELNADGSKRSEEFWVAGKRQGPQKSWDRGGTLTVTEYRDDRPTAP